MQQERIEATGNALLSARKQRQLSLGDVERATGIRQKYLRALESDDYAALPGGAYTKGFLRDYAVFLELDPEPLLAGFEHQVVAATPPTPVRPPTRLLRPGFVLPLGSIMAVIGIASLALFGFYLYQEYAPVVIPTTEVTPVPGATGTVFAPVVVSPTPTSTPTPIPTPTVPVYPGVEVEVSVRSSSWTRVTVDDQTPPDFEGILQDGAVRTWNGKNKVCVRFGNAGGVFVKVNGEWKPEVGKPQGQPGEVVDKCWSKGEQ